MSDVLHPTYLPFNSDQLDRHFAPVASEGLIGRHLAYYEASAALAHDYQGVDAEVGSAENARRRRAAKQIEKDERFWVVTALMRLFHDSRRVEVLTRVLERCLPDALPLDGLTSWKEALGDDDQRRLFFEANLPSPASYRQ